MTIIWTTGEIINEDKIVLHIDKISKMNYIEKSDI